MASNNNENSAAIAVFAFVVAAFYMFAMFVFAIASFVSLVMTVLCIIALFRPIHIGGLSIETWEARGFLNCGVLGMILVPVFVLFCQYMYGVAINDKAWPFFYIGGYVGGSLGYCVYLSKQEEQAAQAVQILPPAPQPPPQITQREEFRFATWDDEEAGR